MDLTRENLPCAACGWSLSDWVSLPAEVWGPSLDAKLDGDGRIALALGDDRGAPVNVCRHPAGVAVFARPKQGPAGRQPFGPLPHTPMQWFAPGLTTDALGEAAKPYLGGRLLNVYDKSGQCEPDALLNAVAMRGGVEVLPMLMDGRPRLRPGRAMRGQFSAWVRSYGLEPERYLGAWDVDAPTPWEFVESAFPKAEVRKAYHRIARMLA